MKVIQKPISKDHLSAMFFEGIIAEEGNYSLRTFQNGELTYDGEYFTGDSIIELAREGVIGDPDIEDENSPCVGIHVDKYFVIYMGEEILDEEKHIYNDFDEALKEFRNYLILNNNFN